MSMGYPVSGWFRWFAWRPVWTHRGPRWLVYVERRRFCMPDWDEPWTYHLHRPIGSSWEDL